MATSISHDLRGQRRGDGEADRSDPVRTIEAVRARTITLVLESTVQLNKDGSASQCCYNVLGQMVSKVHSMIHVGVLYVGNSAEPWRHRVSDGRYVARPPSRESPPMTRNRVDGHRSRWRPMLARQRETK